MTSGYWCTRGVVGSYWISSQISVRATTDPGVTARSRPTSNASGDTIAGIRGAADRSDASARTPRTALSPPVSMSAFQAAGLISGLLLGAAASTRFRTMNPARSASRHPSSASASSDSAAVAPARYSCTIRRRNGFCVHAGSVNRRSRGAGATADRPAVIRPTSVPSAAARRATEPRLAGQVQAQPEHRAVGLEPAQHPEGRVRQQQVQRRYPLGRVGEGVTGVLGGAAARLRPAHDRSRAGAPSVAGGRTSRRRILPVGPLGSWSTSHTCRGYL